jgi:hypothetical protein
MSSVHTSAQYLLKKPTTLRLINGGESPMKRDVHKKPGVTSAPRPSASPPARNSRTIELVRAGWGGALLLTPGPVMSTVHHVRLDRKSVAIARILGARQLAQAFLSGVRPSREVLAMGVWVDAVHALTALGLALVDTTRARAGVTDAAVAALWASAGYRDLTSAQATPPAYQRRRDRLARLVLGDVPGGALLMRRVVAERRQFGGPDTAQDA